ncbi:MAG: hypothetical protein ACFFG0_07485 [Candidatus Thorarchaeota archaeon]
MKSYIKFKIIENKPKTKVWGIYNKNNGIKIGEIRWYGSWRQYCFFPEEGTLFDKTCLTDIINFINKQMELRKK